MGFFYWFRWRSSSKKTTTPPPPYSQIAADSTETNCDERNINSRIEMTKKEASVKPNPTRRYPDHNDMKSNRIITIEPIFTLGCPHCATMSAFTVHTLDTYDDKKTQIGMGYIIRQPYAEDVVYEARGPRCLVDFGPNLTVDQNLSQYKSETRGLSLRGEILEDLLLRKGLWVYSDEAEVMRTDKWKNHKRVKCNGCGKLEITVVVGKYKYANDLELIELRGVEEQYLAIIKVERRLFSKW